MTRKYSSISVETTLASSISNSATSMTVATGTGAALLGGVTLAAGNVDQFTVALDADTINEEIVFITAVSSDTFTIVRGRSGTSAVSHSGGASVKHVLTSDDLNAFTTAINPVTNVQFAGSSSGSTTVQASAAASGTLTLPAATDTLVGKATTDTLTNKTLSSSIVTGTVTAGGGVGTNGQVLTSTGTGVSWSNAAAGTVTSVIAGTGLSGGTITSTGTIAIDSTVATLTGTQTLTNKTIDAASNTLTGVATLTGTQTLTNKTIDYNSNTITNLPGSTSQTLLSTTTLSGASTTISSISGSYNDLYVYIYGVTGLTVPHNITVAFNGNPGVRQIVNYGNVATPATGDEVESATSFNITKPSTKLETSADNNWLIKISNYANTVTAGARANLKYEGYYQNASSEGIVLNAAGSINIDGTAINSITISSSTNTFSAGTVKIYGVK